MNSNVFGKKKTAKLNLARYTNFFPRGILIEVKKAKVKKNEDKKVINIRIRVIFVKYKFSNFNKKS